MSNEAGKIVSFTDLNAWQKGHALVLRVYKLTKNFPDEEKFALTNQIRRAAVSITSNIAEGFTRTSSPDRVHFYTIAHASLTEVQNQLLIARDVHYIDQNDFKLLASHAITVHKLLTGLIKATKQRGSS
jgi:four helix bundle protein